MVRDYELMYIARPELDEDGLAAAVESVNQLIASVGGSVVRSTSWGRRRLAYEVEHMRDGHYMLLHLRADGGRIAEIERALTIHETVFRHLLVLHEAGAEVDAVDPDNVAPVTTRGARDGADEDGAGPRPRQAAVAEGDDDESDADDEDEAPAALIDTMEDEN